MADTKTTASHNIDPARRAFYRRIKPQNLAPLWEVLGDLVTAEPDTTTKPHRWRYDEVRPALLEAGELISAREAERRVLVLENPGLPGEAKITRSMFSGLQLILPGEVAPPHRHSQAALRFVMEGKGAYTSVDGKRVMMEPGDFIITPSWTWHDHGNVSDGPMVWLDGLDIHVLKLFEASFREGEDAFEALPPERTASPEAVFSFPYRQSRDLLDRMKCDEEWSPWHGLKRKYANPAGDYPMPTIATFLQLLPKDFKSAPYRSSSSTVFVCVEGRGGSKVGEQHFDWGPRDIFVAPSWMSHVHEASEESVLFSFSDRAIQEKLGFFREQKGKP